MVWYRLKWSLTRDGWLTVGQCDGLEVNQWSHSLLSTAVRRRYLANDSTRRQLNSLLADYWLGSTPDDDSHSVDKSTYLPLSWWRSTAVERRSLAGELSLSCARPAADG